MSEDVTDRTETDQLLRDASQLYRLIDRVQEFVREHEATCAYPSEAQVFLGFVGDVAHRTKAFLQCRILERALEGRSGLKVAHFRRKVKTLSDSWTRLHDFVKPVVDAHTLRVPSPLLRLLNYQVRSLPMLQNAQVAVEIGGVLNYFQRRHSGLRDIVRQLAQALDQPSLPSFPRDLGIVILPYSQGSALFFNCLLYHELGHYIVEQRSLRNKLNETLLALLTVEFPQQPVDVYSYLVGLMRPWSEEVFCDLVAVRLVGPVFTCVVGELFYLVGGIDKGELGVFGRSHPAPAVRLEQQLALLNELEWSDDLEVLGAPLLGELQAIANLPLPKDPFTDEFPIRPHPKMIDVFKRALPKLGKLAEKTVGAQGRCPSTFRGDHDDIWRCLAHGIVPSALHRANSSVPNSWFTTLINAAYFFQLKGIHELMERAGALHEERGADQARVRQRVEDWTLKAIEDLLPACYPEERHHAGT